MNARVLASLLNISLVVLTSYKSLSSFISSSAANSPIISSYYYLETTFTFFRSSYFLITIALSGLINLVIWKWIKKNKKTYWISGYIFFLFFSILLFSNGFIFIFPNFTSLIFVIINNKILIIFSLSFFIFLFSIMHKYTIFFIGFSF